MRPSSSSRSSPSASIAPRIWRSVATSTDSRSAAALGRQASVVDEAGAAELFLRGVDLVVGPGTGPEVRAHRQTPPQLGEQADLRGREAGGRPRRGVRIAARLAQPVGATPGVAQRIARQRLGEQAGEQRSALQGAPRLPLERAARRHGRLPRAARRGCGRAARSRPGPRHLDGDRIGERPAIADSRHDHGGVEDGEGRGDQLSGHLAHDRAAAAEVGGTVGRLDTGPELAGAGPEAEPLVLGVALGCEVHLRGERLQGSSETTGSPAQLGVVDHLSLYRSSPSQAGARSSRWWLTSAQRSRMSHSCSWPSNTRASDTSTWATIVRLRSDGSVADGYESMADTSSGQLGLPDAGQLGGQHQQVGPGGQRRQRPGEQQREVEAVGRLLVLGQRHDQVLERQQRAGVDLERQVQVERPAARLLGVQVDLPGLPQRVGLDEVALVVHVEPVVDGVVLEVGDEPGDVDGGHGAQPATGADRVRYRVDRAVPRVLAAMDDAAAARACSTTPPPRSDRRSTGSTTGAPPAPGPASTAATWPPTRRRSRCSTRRARGDERGVRPPRAATATSSSCSTPSTAAPTPAAACPGTPPASARSTATGPRAALVVDQASGVRFEAVRGGGARVDGQPLQPSACAAMGEAVVGLSGYPPRYLGWRQFRALGAARPRPVRGRRRAARRLRRLQPERPRPVGLPRRAARLPGGRRARSSTPSTATSSRSTTPPAARRSRRPRPSCSTRSSQHVRVRRRGAVGDAPLT